MPPREIIHRPYINNPLVNIFGDGRSANQVTYTDAESSVTRTLGRTATGIVHLTVDRTTEGGGLATEKYRIDRDTIMYTSGTGDAVGVPTWPRDTNGSANSRVQCDLAGHLAVIEFNSIPPEERPNMAGQGGEPYDRLFAAQGNR